jgi:hypothetical protein
VYNAAGEPIARSRTAVGHDGRQQGLSFPFVVQNVPTGEIFYAIEIASSGPVSFTGVRVRPHMQSGVRANVQGFRRVVTVVV